MLGTGTHRAPLKQALVKLDDIWDNFFPYASQPGHPQRSKRRIEPAVGNIVDQ